ncbi:hypothetical protein NDU88_006527 [Pleurodeles waltl]|uniref:Uncharacterized protein n=1 Tax=Pleurodeles waltl TaxID=8319 RepID=A0AAV7LPC9_PLEWA|nr:hypothetical protein NDU88_006527 [Pleurodeles waltl]
MGLQGRLRDTLLSAHHWGAGVRPKRMGTAQSSHTVAARNRPGASTDTAWTSSCQGLGDAGLTSVPRRQPLAKWMSREKAAEVRAQGRRQHLWTWSGEAAGATDARTLAQVN